MTEDLEPEKLVRLIDKESGETLTMQVAAEFELDGKVYGVLTPAETLIRIFRETADELIEHCRATIASYKKPRTVAFVDALPRDGWAVDYAALDEQFGGGGYPGAG